MREFVLWAKTIMHGGNDVDNFVKYSDNDAASIVMMLLLLIMTFVWLFKFKESAAGDDKARAIDTGNPFI